MVKKSDLKKLNSIMEEAESLKGEKKYNKAVEKLLEGIEFIEDRVKEPEEKRDEIENLKTEIDQIYVVEIIDITNRAYNFMNENDYDRAYKTYEEAMRIADKIEEKELRDEEIQEINNAITHNQLEESIYKAGVLVKEDRYENAVNVLKDTLIKAQKVYKNKPNHEIIDRIKNTINEVYSRQVNLLTEQGDKLKSTGNHYEAIETYKDALKITEKFYESDLKTTQTINLKTIINQVYSTLIDPLLEKGKSLYSQNNFKEAVKEFESALEVARKMFESEQKQQVMRNINSVAADALNPVYLSRVEPLMQKGKELTGREDYAQDLTIVNQAIRNFTEALDIAKNMADSKEKETQVSTISNLIKEVCLTRIDLLRDNSLRKLAQKDYEGAVNELYAAISIAKKIPIEEEENEELNKLKDSVNKAFSSQINEILVEGKAFLTQKNYNEALEIFTKAMDITNKMYLNELMEEEIAKIKSLIYQAELKDLVGRGDLVEEQKKFEKELEKLDKKMEYAKTIVDEQRRFEEMNKIKLAIDEVHYSEIKLIVEQANQLADSGNYLDGFEFFEKAIRVNDLIDSSEYKDKVPIKTNFKNQLINKAKKEIETNNFDQAIEDCEKALELDSTHIDAYFYIGIANSHKAQYDEAIASFKKALDLTKNHAKSWNHMGLVYNKKKEYDEAIESYEKAIEIEPIYTEAFFNMANAYKLKNQLNKAIDIYKKVTEIEPDHAMAWLFLGHCYLKKNDYYSAVESIEKATSLDSSLEQELNRHINEFKDSIEKMKENISKNFENKLNSLF
jgi:tetratricopeptide (TPR) repeat protein